MKTCEVCGKPPERLKSGPFAGDYSMLDYCELCSKDLCDDCMKKGYCSDALDHKHLPSAESEE